MVVDEITTILARDFSLAHIKPRLEILFASDANTVSK